MDLYTLAQRYVGMALELPGADKNHPLIQWWLSLCGFGLDSPDETAWCSAFLNGMAWELRLPRSKSAAARSWLTVGRPIELLEAQVGDVVIFNRGGNPNASVLDSPGHVGLFAGWDHENLLILGGNQGNNVGVSAFKIDDVLGVRRLT